VEEERYVENLGLVYRRIGNVEYKLVSARVGAIDFQPAPNRAAQLALEKVTISRERPTDKALINGQLRITATPYSYPVTVRFADSFPFQFILQDKSRNPLPDGTYSVTAWLKTLSCRRLQSRSARSSR
jgi:hypothetical protein